MPGRPCPSDLFGPALPSKTRRARDATGRNEMGNYETERTRPTERGREQRNRGEQRPGERCSREGRGAGAGGRRKTQTRGGDEEETGEETGRPGALASIGDATGGATGDATGAMVSDMPNDEVNAMTKDMAGHMAGDFAWRPGSL